MRKKYLLTVAISVFLLQAVAGLPFVSLVTANPGPATQIPPVVRVSEIQVNVTLSEVNETFWATVDAEYQMVRVYGFGDKYQTQNYGMGLLTGPDQVNVTVAYDRLDVQYPLPLDATNICVKLDGAELDWDLSTRFYHLFDANLPELHWKISPVPQNFSLTTHYKHPVPSTSQTYDYLGQYALLFPLGARHELHEVINYSFAGYPWFVNSTTAKIHLQLEESFVNLQAYSIDGFGTLTLINHTTSKDASKTMDFMVLAHSPNSQTTSPYGIVVIFNKSPENLFSSASPFYSASSSGLPAFSSFSLVLLVSAGVAAFAALTVLLVYRRWRLKS
ncbi:MAG: hypothetical protein NWF00_04370 [Candidatus Bathyarchaeota archaeon]|nr:hypothetical protein [Candidatus Bathyarchaeota archaeon]